MRTCGAKHEGKDTAEKTKGCMDNINKELCSFIRLYNAFLVNKIYPMTFAAGQEAIELFANYQQVYHNYYKLSLDFENMKQIDKDNSYILFKDIKDENLKKFIVSNYSDLYFINFKNIVIPQYNSKLMKLILDSKEIKDVLKNNFHDISYGKYKNKSLDIVFKQTRDLYLTIGKAKLYNMRVSNGYISGTLVDYYDFSEIYYNLKGYNNYKNSIVPVIANNNAVLQQNLGRLTNYFIVMPILIPVGNILN